MISKKNTMTLIELVIVLAILSSLATMAISGADKMLANKRLNDTIRRGKIIYEAIHGDGLQTSRFISDMGRLPLVTSTSEGKLLQELWILPNSNIKFSSVAWVPSPIDQKWDDDINDGYVKDTDLPINNDLTLYCGWRGPYINVGDQANYRLYDGFGNDWKILDKNGNIIPPVIGTQIYGVASLGKDKVITTNVPIEPDDIDRFYNFNIINSSDLTINITSPLPSILSDNYKYLRAALFIPEVTQTTLKVAPLHFNWEYPVDDTTKSGNYYFPVDPTMGADCINKNFSQIKYNNLTPGTYKLFIYGYKLPGGDSNAGSSGITEIDIKPGHNKITVTLINGRWR